jgi:signal transduction histidine kinase
LRKLLKQRSEVELQEFDLNEVISGALHILSPIQTALAGDSAVEVSVTDFGTGIPKDKLEGIFDSFYTTKGHGTGLGLSIARAIIETYGGKIWAENRNGGGAVFHFTLPLVEPSRA